MLRWFTADLHIHTCLSPCSDLAMSPRKIVAKAAERRIGIIAVTDHNAAANTGAVMRAAAGSGVVVLPGLEICTREEVHLLAIMETETSALALQRLIQDHMSGVNDPEAIGLQVIANEKDEVEGFEEKLLIGASDLPLEQIVDAIHGLNGAAIAAHIDRESYSIVGQLGFIPEGLALDALELSLNITDDAATTAFHQYGRFAFVRNSDAHAPGQIGRNVSRYLIEEPCLSEIMKAYRNCDGRRVITQSGST